MFGLIATLVFAAAGCFATAAIVTSLRAALPALRRLAAERASLAEDHAYLVRMIETPRACPRAPGMAATAITPVRTAPLAAIMRRAQAPLPAGGASMRAAA